jgi:hypothetical protein
MPIETAGYLSELNTALPAATDGLQQADDHLRLIKGVIKATFPNFTAAALSATQAQLDGVVNAVVNGTVAIRWLLGTAALPGLTPAGDTNTGIYSPGADQLGFAVNGVAALTIAANKDAAFAGNVAVTGTFGATGNATFAGTLGVTGNVTLGGTLGVTGNSTLTGTLTVNGATTTIAGILKATGTDHMELPKGTTAQRGATSLAAGWYRYNTSLDLPEWVDNGGVWRQPSIAPPSAAAFKNLVVTNNAAVPNNRIDVDADELVVETTAGVAFRLRDINLTINCGTTGANALDAGGLAINDWVSVWVIYNPATDTIAGLASASTTAPTMPAGYTAKARVGWMRTQSTSVFHRTRQLGRRAQYVISATITTGFPVIEENASGTHSASAPTYTSKSVASVVPPTAGKIAVTVVNNDGGAGPHACYVAPNTNYGGYQSSSPPPIFVGGVTTGSACGEMLLEALTVGYVGDGSGAGAYCTGWEDNI